MLLVSNVLIVYNLLCQFFKHGQLPRGIRRDNGRSLHLNLCKNIIHHNYTKLRTVTAERS